ncbi:MAG: AMP-binding protein [Fusobacteriaceae bacterium]
MDFVRDYNKTAIIYDGDRISYNEMIRRIKGYSEIVEIEEEDKVVIYMENRPELIYSFLGVWDKKGTNVCLDSTFSGEELQYYFKDSNPKYIFTSEKNKANVAEALTALNMSVPVIVVDEHKPQYTGTDLVTRTPDSDQVALMLYTSGTTGEPKGVMLTFDNVLVNIEGLDTYKMYRESDVVLALLPMHHIFSLIGAGIVPFSKGATIVFLKELSAQAMIDAFKEHKVTLMLGVPRLWEALHKKIMDKINSSPVTAGIFKIMAKVQNKELSKKIFKKVHEGFGGNIRFFVSGGSKLNPQVAEDFLTLGIDVCEGYGLTETAPMITFTPINQVVPGSAGKVMPGVEIKFLDDGEILSRGRNLMRGYYNKPEATAEAIDSEGWFHTGDLGEMRGEYLFVTGRKKEMIVLSNGKNLNPIEIEMWLSEKSDLIQEVAVTEYNSLLTAVIFPNFQKMQEEGVTNITETLKWGVIDKYNNSVPNYKKILDVRVVREELPKTRIGKIRRFMLGDVIEGVATEKKDIVEPTFEEYLSIKEFLVNLKNKEIISTAHLELDLGLDSLDITELLAYLQHSFGIKAEQSLLLDYPTVVKLAEYVRDNATEGNMEEVNWNTELNSVRPVELKGNIVGKVAKLLLKPIFALYLREKITGRENIIAEPAIYVGNHQSFADAFLFNNAANNMLLTKAHYIAKVKHFNTPFRRALAENGNLIIMDINKSVGDSLKDAAAVLKSGGSVVIFPEGARTRDGKMLEFKKSFAILAKELNVPVVPFGIKGAYELFPANEKFPKSGEVELKFFQKFHPEDMSYEEIIKKARDVIKNWVEIQG